MSVHLFTCETAVGVILVSYGTKSWWRILTETSLRCRSAEAVLLSSSFQELGRWSSHHLRHCLSAGRRERETAFLPQKTFSHHPPAIPKTMPADFRLFCCGSITCPIPTDGHTVSMVQMWPIEELRVVKNVWCPLKGWCECPGMLSPWMTHINGLV